MRQAGILFILCWQDLLEYRKKLRTLRVRMLDGTLKTLLVDDSQPVANLMVVICTKIGGCVFVVTSGKGILTALLFIDDFTDFVMLPGITNHDEYSLVRENQEEELENKPNFGTLTLKRKKEEKERDAKMDQLRKKLKTDDEGRCCHLYCVACYETYSYSSIVSFSPLLRDRKSPLSSVIPQCFFLSFLPDLPTFLDILYPNQ
jgi:hypothetical protein